MLQFARVLLQMVHPSTEKVTEEKWVGGPREGMHRGSGLTHTFSRKVYILGVWCSAERTQHVPFGQDRRCVHMCSLKQ